MNNELEFPIHLAARSGHEEIVKLLIKYDATVNVRNRNYWTPLFYSVLSGNEKVVKVLFNHEDEDFSLNDTDAQGKTVFHICAEKGTNLDNLFIQINSADRKYFFSQFLIGSVAIGKILHSYGANVSAVDDIGQTPLHILAESGNLKTKQ